ncbi:MAG: glycosyltransferase family 4 protein [Vulcanimicrobiaceae bacterium]
MKIAIDAQLTVGTATGIGEYVNGLVAALREEGIDVIPLVEPKLDPWRFDRRVYWDQVLLPQRARACGADLLHCASGTVPIGATMPLVATVHDVAWLRVQAHGRPYARYYFGRFATDRYRRLAAIAVDSAFSGSELLEMVEGLRPERIRVVYPGVAHDFCTLERRGGDGRTILVVGTVERRKNLELIVRALPFLENARIVCVGPFTSYRDECIAIARELGVEERIEFRGYVERDALLELYATCAVVAMPSRYEGFGYGLAQGLCAGAPCVASDRSALPEIALEDAPVLSIDHLAPWVDALAAALRGEADARAFAARSAAIERFAWRRSARAMIEAYKLALGGSTPSAS